jgi:hypothetical protein
MKHESPAIAESFRQLDFHDDTFAGMRVLPSQSRSDNTGSVVELQILQYAKQERKVLRFIGCANLRVGVDFDVLAHNLPPNTSGVDAHTDKDEMWTLMQSQTRDWGVKYAADMGTPLDTKIQVMNELVCFRVQLCGGVVEIIARRYEVEALGKHNAS